MNTSNSRNVGPARRSLYGVVALAFLNTLFVSTIASAEGRAIACFVLPKDDSQAQAAAVMSSILRGELAKLSGVEVRTGAPSGNPEAAIEAEKLTAQGFEALNTGDKTTALTRFERASDLLAQNPGAGSIVLHAKVAKGLGVASFLNGNTSKATELMKRSLLLYPDQKPVEYAYSVDVKNVYDFARRDILERAPGNIEVRSTPDSAEVFLDGNFKGYTPITLPNVPAGSHLVEVARDGFLRWGTTAIVPEGGRVATEAQLTSSPNKSDFDRAIADVSRNWNQQRFGKASEALMAATAAREIIAVKASLGQTGFEVSGFVRDLSGSVKPVQAVIVRDANFYKSVQEFLTSSLGAVPVAGSGNVSLGGPPKALADTVMKESAEVGGDVVIDPEKQIFGDLGDGKGDESITDTWWFWTIVGVGTAALAGAITAVVLTSGAEDDDGGAVGNLNIRLDKVGQ
jgi:hypothetical protein